MHNKAKLFIVSAPSGAGKTTLVQALINKVGHLCAIERAITYTTKQMRQGEVAGVDYIYISQEEFEHKADQGFFLEITKGLGHYYGTPRTIVDKVKAGISQILVIDRLGAATITRQYPQAVLIWIKVRGIEVLRERLMNRASDTQEQIERRLIRAQHEIEEEERSSFYKHHIINDDFERALYFLHSLVIKELEISNEDASKGIKGVQKATCTE